MSSLRTLAVHKKLITRHRKCSLFVRSFRFDPNTSTVWNPPKSTSESKITSIIAKKVHFLTRFLSSNTLHSRPMSTFEKLKFDNLALRRLPLDTESDNFVREVRGACFSKVTPASVDNPRVVAVSLPALSLLDLTEADVQSAEFAEYFAGNKILHGSEPAAHCYCGHQFGNFAGQLGDGAAMYLGEVINESGERWEIQIKGAGPTPYSRQADGRKVLRSSIREFLCSEAMHHLGIPTTRAGSCVTSDSKVIRDIFYSGQPVSERCTVVLRIAPTFIRFGSFQITKPVDRMTGREGPSVCLPQVVRALTDYVIDTFYPQVGEQCGSDRTARVKAFLREVVHRTARLVAQWQCVGWCHGVLNTDNMSIVGATIDYGPYGFMDRYDPDFICNASDDGGRYTYARQPEMCKWNCLKLAEALQEQVPLEELALIVEEFEAEYERHWILNMRKKLGLLARELPEDKALVESFLDTMHKTGADFTNSFRLLSSLPLPSSPDYKTKRAEVMDGLMEQCCTMEELVIANKPRMDPRQLQMLVMLLERSPEILAQMGRGAGPIMKELERREKYTQLTKKTQEEKKSEDGSLWSAWLDVYSNRLKQEEGHDLQELNDKRVKVMNENNPRFILRNYMAQHAIEAAEQGDYSKVQRVLHILQDPYSTEVDAATEPQPAREVASDEAETSTGSSALIYDSKPPLWAADLRVT